MFHVPFHTPDTASRRRSVLKYHIENHYKWYVWGILLMALLIRIAYAAFFPIGLSPDAQNYYTSAINIVNGNGYSICTKDPYLPFYFREPLTSYTIAFVIWLYKSVMSYQELGIPTNWEPNIISPYHQQIILCVQIFNAILQAVSLYLFSRIVKKKSNSLIAICFLMTSSIYFPLIISNCFLLREPYVFFFLSLLAFYWSKYLDSTKVLNLVPIALSNGVLCLYLQSYWLLGFILLVFIFIRLIGNYRKFISHFFAYVTLFVCSITPHLFQVYHYYPDIRIVKNMGSALSMDYVNALNAYRAHGVNPYGAKNEDFSDNIEVHPEIFSIEDASKVFEYTFNGTYKNEAYRINSINTNSKKTTFFIDKLLLSFRNTVFIVGITYDYGVFNGCYSFNDIVKFLFVLPYLVFGILAVFGLWFFIKKYWMLCPVFIYHAGLFFVFGDEERRQIMLIPYIICMAFISLHFIYKNYAHIHHISRLSR